MKTMGAKHILKWRLHAMRQDYQSRIKKAEGYITEALTTPNKIWSVSWSGGKDSTVLVDMVMKQNRNVFIFCQVDDLDWARKREYLLNVATKNKWDIELVEPGFSVKQWVSNIDLRKENICAKAHKITQQAFLNVLQVKQQEKGVNAVFLGLRKQESNNRRIHLNTHKYLYSSGAFFYSCPLAELTVLDCFAYLVSNNIEINPCYFYNRFKEPEEIRTGWAIPHITGIAYGDKEHLRYYGDKTTN